MFVFNGKVRKYVVVYLDDGLLVRTAEAVYEVCARHRIQFDHCHSCTILAAVMLLLHEEI